MAEGESEGDKAADQVPGSLPEEFLQFLDANGVPKEVFTGAIRQEIPRYVRVNPRVLRLWAATCSCVPLLTFTRILDLMICERCNPLQAHDVVICEDASWAAALILYFASGCEGLDAVWSYMEERRMLQMERLSFLAYTKELTTLVHKFGKPPVGMLKFDDDDRQQVRAYYAWQYLHVLVGRGNFSDEREEEVADRQKDLPGKRAFDVAKQKWTEAQYQTDMDDVADRLRENVVRAGYGTKLLTFDAFWQELWCLGTQGFAAQSKFMLNITRKLNGQKAATSKRYMIRLTKKGAISLLSKAELRKRLEEDGICSSTGSLKYEEEAVRTLFAGDVVHYLISAWATAKLEESMYRGSSIVTDLGLQAIDELKFMLRMSEHMHRRTWAFAYDFRNFNAQHSKQDMKRYYQLLKEAGTQIDHNYDWIRAMDGLLESVDNTCRRATGDKKFVRALSGLLFGIRATQGINTSMNISYMDVINRCIDRIIRSTFTLDSKSHGDDVNALIDSWLCGILMFYCAQEIGYVAQDLKVTLEAGRTQYLRIAYGRDRSLNGYLARAIARFTSTEWKPRYRSLLADRLGELNAQISLLRRRGMCQEMANATFDVMRQFYGGEGSGLPGYVKLSDALAHSCVESNGAGILHTEDDEEPIYLIAECMPRAPITQPTGEVLRVISSMPKKAIYRYWHLLAENFPDINGLHTEKTRDREVAREHIGDCMAQLPKHLQHADRMSRNEAFRNWVHKWEKAYKTAYDAQNVKRSIDPRSLSLAKQFATEDVEILEVIAHGHDLDFSTRSQYERLTGAIERKGIRITTFVTTAIKRAAVTNRIKYVMPFIDGDFGGYSEPAVLKLVLDGIQFNQMAGKMLPAQFLSVIRNRAIYNFEIISRDLDLMRAFVYAYEVYMYRNFMARPLFQRGPFADLSPAERQKAISQALQTEQSAVQLVQWLRAGEVTDHRYMEVYACPVPSLAAQCVMSFRGWRKGRFQVACEKAMDWGAGCISSWTCCGLQE
ncbi:unnamed protein product [Cladocopium goreaui]|uniref:RNA-directed RNA polymerase n=1 Tax=Cladocopium goreaui TaxID=2562237 RepID=A0A9P1G4I2_9DINO|nr:unnamed protein product [Cladocopium goreaui]